MIAAMEKGGFRAPGTFEDLRRLIQGYLGEGNKMGEGWLLTAEMLGSSSSTATSSAHSPSAACPTTSLARA